MANIYSPGEIIPELEGSISGGYSLRLDNYEELAKFGQICKGLASHEIATQLNKEIIDKFNSASVNDNSFDETPSEEPLIFAVQTACKIWKLQEPDKNKEIRVIFAAADKPDARLAIRSKRPALAIYPGSLTVSFLPINIPHKYKWLIPWIRFAETLYNAIKQIIGSTTPLWMIYYGLKPTAWVIAFVLSKEAAPDIEIMEDLRRMGDIQSTNELPRLDKMEENEFKDKKGILVLLHGLFSTDIGTFDGFIDAWGTETIKDKIQLLNYIQNNFNITDDEFDIFEKIKFFTDNLFDNFFTDNYIIVGWPHNTLAGIDENAHVLKGLIEDKIGKQGLPFAFVCHSRGGLLARRTALLLKPEYRTFLKGCVTFGTPHRGAKLADYAEWLPEQAAGQLYCLIALGITSVGTKSLMALSQVLRYTWADGEYQGIKDLATKKPRGWMHILQRLLPCLPIEKKTFVARLDKIENKNKGRALSRRTDIYAVAGKAPVSEDKKNRWLYTFIQKNISKLRKSIEGGENDLVVAVSSSHPKSFQGHVELISCDHFHYFTDESSKEPAFLAAVDFLRCKMKVYNDFILRPNYQHNISNHGKGKIIRLDKEVIIDGVRVPIREESKKTENEAHYPGEEAAELRDRLAALLERCAAEAKERAALAFDYRFY